MSGYVKVGHGKEGLEEVSVIDVGVLEVGV